MDLTFVAIVCVLLVARAGLQRDVPMVAIYLSCGAWALHLVWGTLGGLLDWSLGLFGLIERYEAPPSLLGIVDSAIGTITGLVLVIAVVLAARGARVEPRPS